VDRTVDWQRINIYRLRITALASTLLASIPSGWNLICFDSWGLCVDAITVKPIQRVAMPANQHRWTRNVNSVALHS